MNYWQNYQRNIGLFSRSEQKALQNAKIFIAGVGGAGGIEAATLARFGVCELIIMDPGIFDEPDMNRQFAAMTNTIGQNKAKATAQLLQNINPHLKLQVFDYVVEDECQLTSLMQGCNLVIDAIDYIGFDYKAKFAKTARDLGLINITAPIPGFGTLMMIFEPQGMKLEELYQAPADEALWPDFRIPLDKVMGKGRLGAEFKDFLSKKISYISTCAGSAALNGGLVATEAALIITGLRKKEDIVFAPYVTYVDILKRVFEVYRVLP